jgi:hypothetical protein
MKALILCMGLLTAFQALALDRTQADRLLQERQLTLRGLEQSGGKLILGEVTGAGLVLPADRLQVVLLQDRAVLKREIESMAFSPVTGKLGDLDSFRVGGTYFTREDIRGVVVK